MKAWYIIDTEKNEIIAKGFGTEREMWDEFCRLEEETNADTTNWSAFRMAV